ncbi:hypothetical protein HW532_10255 [Kaustia mangrovi]|uniref:Uncharacterized protein n=1 Tax=Kaustia mangrovi TaxID=2593653 RepID=A0A7S8C4A1_9HYPH|nr:hypothetical protein [Kaustia mangrovi]QPC43039.1 hypothetical protein HW532_10255 [Kaustia mangrovi]
MTRPSRTRDAGHDARGNIIDIEDWLFRVTGQGSPAGGPQGERASPEEFLVVWLSMLPDGERPARAARAMLERFNASRRSPPTLYELRLHELLGAVACHDAGEAENDRSGPGRRGGRRAARARKSDVIPFPNRAPEAPEDADGKAPSLPPRSHVHRR